MDVYKILLNKHNKESYLSLNINNKIDVKNAFRVRIDKCKKGYL